MKTMLDRALAEILGSLAGLRAVILSVAPDGLLAWCWSNDGDPGIALGFAALDRAATTVLEELGASQHSRSLLLAAEDAWVTAWPLDENFVQNELFRPRLVITSVFSGHLQTGMVMLYGTRIRMHIRAALTAARDAELERLRSRLVAAVQHADQPAQRLLELSESTGIELRRFVRLESLDEVERRRLEAELSSHRG